MSGLPTRPLGKTGMDVSILALGGVRYNFLKDVEAAVVVHRAIDLGINTIDTAHGYKESERKIGLVMAERRDEVILITKSGQRGRNGMAAEIEESFKRLQTDRIDCVQIHDLHTEEDLAKITGPDGALKAIESFQRDGSVRFVGVTSHVNPDILIRALREYPFDTIMTSLGAMHAAVRPFYETIMPVARERGMGVLAMKAMAYGFLKNHAERALRFVLGLPGVSAAVVGVDDVAQVERNAAVARAFQPLTEMERTDLLDTAQRIYRERQSEAWFIHR